jgi:N-acetylmuramoyl-L-alanine amidase
VAIRARLFAIAAVGCTLLGVGPGLAVDAPGSATAEPLYPVANDYRIGGDDRQTRFVIDLSRKIDVNAFTLADPYRVVIDVPQLTFKLPANAGKTGRALVKAFRYGLVLKGGSRIVLDVDKPVRIEKAFSVEAADGQPARLVLDLTPVDRGAFMRTIAQDNRAKTSNTASIPARPPANDNTRPLIVIDAGHGGIDNGTQAASGEPEKEIVLDFATMLKAKLEKTGHYRLMMTRSDDTFISLGDRVKIARDNQASLFISIHADALARGEGDAQGATVYTLSEKASDAEAARLAESENRADAISGVDLSSEPDDVADILIDLVKRETKSFSSLFAHTLVGEMKRSARLHKHPLKSAGFKVLKAPDVPSVLVELGYVSNKADLKQLMSDEWREKTAGSVADAVEQFFSTRIAGAPTSTAAH